MGDTPVPAYQQEILSLIGFQNKHIVIRKPTLFKSIHIPAPGFALSSWGHDEYFDSMAVWPEEEPVRGKRLYISRSKARGCKNETVLEDFLKKRGWTILHPQDVSVKRKLTEMSSAETILTIAGSALHDLVFFKGLKAKIFVIPRIHSNTYNIIANKKSNNYFLLNIDMFYHSETRGAEAEFNLNIEQVQDVILKTNDFSRNMNSIEYLLSKPDVYNNKNDLYNMIYDSDCTVYFGESMFYCALLFDYMGKKRESLDCVNILIKKNILEDYMLGRCMNILQKGISNHE